MEGAGPAGQDYVWVDDESTLRAMMARLNGAPIVAVDTESNSLFAYFEKVCLLQFSVDGWDYLVDPFSVNVEPLGPFFADARIEKVFHAAEYDILCLKRDYGFQFNNLFDTMLAARLLGWKQYGLGTILEEHFGVHLNKGLQRYNWGTRPLSAEALAYARFDTHFLPALRSLERDELSARQRLEEAYQVSQRQARLEPVAKVFDPDDFWRIRGARDLSPEQQAILKEVFVLRDQIARRLDRPPFKVVTDAALVTLATSSPRSRRELDRVAGLSHLIRRQYSHDMLQAVARGLGAAPPRFPRNSHHRRDIATENNYESLRAWRNELAAARDVEPDVILTNHALMVLATEAPQTADALALVDVLDDWQRETYGSAILNVLKLAPH